MITLEIVSKTRRPIKRYALFGILSGIILLIAAAVSGHRIPPLIPKMMLVLSALTFIACLFIFNYSYKFKNVIGHITFSKKYIEIEIAGTREIIRLEDIAKIKFKLIGYEGLNTSTFIDFLIMPLISLFSYHSGINNYVYISTTGKMRKFEIYIPDRQNWRNLKSIAKYYHNQKK